MNLITLSFLVCILLSAASAIASDVRGQKWLTYFFRPFTIALMIGFVLETGTSSFYRLGILVALFFCLLGDFMMMLKKKKFLAGMLFFLLAQISMVAAFYSRLKPGFLVWPVFPLVGLGAAILWLIWKNLGHYRVAVLVYVLALLTMVRMGLEMPHQLPGLKPWLAAGGAILFLLSDLFLAIERFYKPFRYAQVCILSTFYASLILISFSAR